MSEAPSQKYFTPQEVLAQLDHKVVIGTLGNWRYRGEGPPFRKIGGRVLYPVPEFRNWERSRQFTDTSYGKEQ